MASYDGYLCLGGIEIVNKGRLSQMIGIGRGPPAPVPSLETARLGAIDEGGLVDDLLLLAAHEERPGAVSQVPVDLEEILFAESDRLRLQGARSARRGRRRGVRGRCRGRARAEDGGGKLESFFFRFFPPFLRV